jgi:hypothetical protein
MKTNESLGWENKVKRVIGTLCNHSWYVANHDKKGCRYKTHHSYYIPQEAKYLLECLDMQDRTQAEINAKTYMMTLRDNGMHIDNL